MSWVSCGVGVASPTRRSPLRGVASSLSSRAVTGGSGMADGVRSAPFSEPPRAVLPGDRPWACGVVGVAVMVLLEELRGDRKSSFKPDTCVKLLVLLLTVVASTTLSS